MRLLIGALCVMTAAATGACSLFTIEQEPFPPLSIQARRGAPPPPRVVLTASSIKINEKIQFALGSAEILPASDGLLGEIAQMMTENPQIELLQVEGHTDSTGSAELNKRLSRERAESVRKHLVERGKVPGKRLSAVGFGPDKPIASNDTDADRELNRRVEFNIVKQGPKKTLVQDE